MKHIHRTGIIYDCHLRLSKYFYNTGHWTFLIAFFPMSNYQLVMPVGKLRPKEFYNVCRWIMQTYFHNLRHQMTTCHFENRHSGYWHLLNWHFVYRHFKFKHFCIQAFQWKAFWLQISCLQTFCLQTFCLQTFCLQAFDMHVFHMQAFCLRVRCADLNVSVAVLLVVGVLCCKIVYQLVDYLVSRLFNCRSMSIDQMTCYPFQEEKACYWWW